MFFVSGLDAAQDFDGLFNTRLIDHDRLEAPFERRVRFDVLAVLFQRGRADHLQFAARKRRLEDVGRVHRGARRAGAHQHVHLVDEQDCAGTLQLVDHAFEAFLKLPAVHGARHQRAHVAAAIGARGVLVLHLQPVHVALHAVRPRRGVAFVHAVEVSALRRLDVIVREQELADARLEREAVHAVVATQLGPGGVVDDRARRGGCGARGVGLLLLRARDSAEGEGRADRDEAHQSFHVLSP